MSATDTEFERIGQAVIDSKQASFDTSKQQTSHQKQLEVGASISSTSSNISPLNRSPSSSSELLHFHSLTFSSERQPLSPLNECVELTTPSPRSYHSENLPSLTAINSCDGQQKKLRSSSSSGSSPSNGGAINDFVGTEFYMDESLPSSISENPTDSQHQAVVSLLQVLDAIFTCSRPTSRS